MGILDVFRRRKKNKTVDNDPDRHYVDSLDYFEEEGKALEEHCPECAKAQKHVHMVESEGEVIECPECHYLRETRRM